MHALGGRQRYGDIPPNQTLYVNNLNEKIKVPEMKCCLTELFGTYGEVIEIVAFGTLKKKGQAFVVFADISCATNAMRALQSFVFLDKPMRISYSKSKSDIVSQEDGTFKPRGKAGEKAAKEEEAAEKKKAPARPKAAEPKSAGRPKDTKDATPAPKMMPHPGAAPQKEEGEKDGQPSNVLFVENLPPEVNEMMLTMLFRQYPGFQEARLIKGRNVAFIEYSDELQAGIAKHGLQGFMVTPEMALKISFAKQ